MKVVEKDKFVIGMLNSELRRSKEMVKGLQRSVRALPKGVLNERKKCYKNKVYFYFSLKYRDGDRVINQHIPQERVHLLKEQIAKRKKIEKELALYEKKISYLSKVIRVGR